MITIHIKRAETAPLEEWCCTSADVVSFHSDDNEFYITTDGCDEHVTDELIAHQLIDPTETSYALSDN